MNGNYRKLLNNLAIMAGIAGTSLVVTLPSQAKEVANAHPSIFSEAHYSRSQGIYTSTDYTVQAAIATEKNNLTSGQKLAQRGLNPRPSIFNEPPYNRSRQAAPDSSTPSEETPTAPTTEVPTETPEQAPVTGTSDKNKNVVQLAKSNGSFKILTQALTAAGLIQTLEGKGPFTIFAPTDEAFNKLPPDALKDLLKPENKEVLVKILTYHVVSGKVLSTDLKSGQVTSLQGDPISVKVDSNGVVINDGNVTQADIQGSNGVIHAIDKVILPPSL